MKKEVKILLAFVVVLTVVGTTILFNTTKSSKKISSATSKTTATKVQTTKTTTTRPTTTKKTNQDGKKPITVHIYYGETCGYCQRLHAYIDTLKNDPTINYKFVVDDKEVWSDRVNSLEMERVADFLDDNVTGVPYYIIGSKSATGYSETMNSSIRKVIEEAYEEQKKDVLEVMAASKN